VPWFRWLLVGLIAITLTKQSAAQDVLTQEQKSAIEALIHNYYLSHPEAFIEALKNAQSFSRASATNATNTAPTANPATVAARRNDLIADPRTPSIGNANGDVTIVEFFDYRCPYCKRVHPSIADLVKDDPNVRIIYKDLPVLGPDSVFAARVALAASMQGAYQHMHDAMLEATSPLTNDTVMALAEAAGLNKARLQQDMNAPEVEAALARNADLAKALGIRGTPTFVVADTVIPGAIEPSGMRKLVEATRQGLHADNKSSPATAKN
jgi:protein-disulfide isomerase